MICDGPTWCIEYDSLDKPFGDSPIPLKLGHLGMVTHRIPIISGFGRDVGKCHGNRRTAETGGCKNLETHTHIHIKSHRYIYPCI